MERLARQGIRTRIAERLLRTRFGREAMGEGVDLSLLRTKPTPRVRLGLVLVGLSYLIGWPAVALLAALAYALEEPLILAVGGPVTYGLSHLVFMIGSWMAGGRYVRMFLLWTTRQLIEKMGGVPPSAF